MKKKDEEEEEEEEHEEEEEEEEGVETQAGTAAEGGDLKPREGYATTD